MNEWINQVFLEWLIQHEKGVGVSNFLNFLYSLWKSKKITSFLGDLEDLDSHTLKQHY